MVFQVGKHYSHTLEGPSVVPTCLATINFFIGAAGEDFFYYELGSCDTLTIFIPLQVLVVEVGAEVDEVADVVGQEAEDGEVLLHVADLPLDNESGRQQWQSMFCHSTKEKTVQGWKEARGF